jgi:hypothetical protein
LRTATVDDHRIHSDEPASRRRANPAFNAGSVIALPPYLMMMVLSEALDVRQRPARIRLDGSVDGVDRHGGGVGVQGQAGNSGRV